MQTLENKMKLKSKIIAITTFFIGISIFIEIIFSAILILFILNNNLLSDTGIYQFIQNAFNVQTANELTAELLTGIISSCLLLLIVIRAYKFFKTIQHTAKPFDAHNIKTLKKAGIAMLIYAFIKPIARRGFYASLAAGLPYQESLDPAFIIAALLLFALTIIFNYGAQLQQLADETL